MTRFIFIEGSDSHSLPIFVIHRIILKAGILFGLSSERTEHRLSSEEAFQDITELREMIL